MRQMATGVRIVEPSVCFSFLFFVGLCLFSRGCLFLVLEGGRVRFHLVCFGLSYLMIYFPFREALFVDVDYFVASGCGGSVLALGLFLWLVLSGFVSLCGELFYTSVCAA